MSYLPPSRQWYVHPGDQHANLYDPPGKFGPNDSRTCLSCHSTTQPAKGFLPDERFFGVGCESCHGPGSAHIQAVRLKQRDLRMEKLERWGAARLTAMCGRCHSKPGAADEALVDPKDTRRFAANALMQSRCFLQSGDRLSCMSCHNPHTDASTDRSKYDRVCLSCHSPALSAEQAGRGNPCPRNPQTGCTSCHMPAGKFEPSLALPTLMTEHYIRPPALMKPLLD